MSRVNIRNNPYKVKKIFHVFTLTIFQLLHVHTQDLEECGST